MLGAIIGDMVGSRYEFHPVKSKNFNIFDLEMRMTDDSYLTIAVAKTLMKHYPIKYDNNSLVDLQKDLIKEFVNAWEEHKSAGFGGMFYEWCCNDPKYGGRGITMCKEWRESFDAFKEWALAHGYQDGMTLDRVCNNRGYDPGNCRWITKRQQCYNRKTNRFITINGRTQTLEQWAAEMGIGPDVIKHREDRGWSIQEAILTPKGMKRRSV